MNKQNIRLFLMLGIATLSAFASVGFCDYQIVWSTIDGGGAMFSAGGDYSLGGTIGQPDAGAMSASGYTLFGGFWGDEAAPYAVYLPIVIK